MKRRAAMAAVDLEVENDDGGGIGGEGGVREGRIYIFLQDFLIFFGSFGRLYDCGGGGRGVQLGCYGWDKKRSDCGGSWGEGGGREGGSLDD